MKKFFSLLKHTEETLYLLLFVSIHRRCWLHFCCSYCDK